MPGLNKGDTVEHTFTVDPKFVGVVEKVPGSDAAQARIRGRVTDLSDGTARVVVIESNHINHPVGSDYTVGEKFATQIKL